MTVRLFHLPGTRSSRVLWTLEEIGASFELVVFAGPEKFSAEHRRRHPLARVPVLELDDGAFVFESGAICLQLADLHPEAELAAPLGTTERAHVYQWSFFAMAELEPAVFGWRRARRAGDDETAFAARLAPLGALVAAAVGGAGGPWLLGERFTVADVLCASVLGGLYRSGSFSDEPDPVAEYVARAFARPACVRAEAVRSVRA